MNYNVELDLKNKSESYAFNQVAAQANGAVWLKSETLLYWQQL